MQVTFPEKDIDWTVKNNDVRTKSLIKNTNTKLWQKSEQCASFDKTESKRRTSWLKTNTQMVKKEHRIVCKRYTDNFDPPSTTPKHEE